MMGWHVPEPDESVPPDPTEGRVTAWGNTYPCLKIRDKGGGSRNWQCGGMMQPAKRCKRFDGRLWRKFTCDRCKREAWDWKDQSSSSSSSSVDRTPTARPS